MTPMSGRTRTILIVSLSLAGLTAISLPSWAGRLSAGKEADEQRDAAGAAAPGCPHCIALAEAPPEAKTHKAKAATRPAKPAEQLAPQFALHDQDGKKVSLSDYAGKTVVLEWFNPDCPFVRYHYRPETRTMARLAGKYRDKGVVWLAINSTHYFDREKNKAFHAKHKLPYAVLDDHAGDVGRAYGAKTTPHMFVVDAKGRIVYRGAIDDNPLGKKPTTRNHVDAALAELVAGKKVSRPETRPYGCSVKYAKRPSWPEEYAFTLKDQDGKAVSSADLAGKVVVLEWVNPDCPFVQRHYRAGTMADLARKYQPRGVVWLAVNSTHYFDREKNKAFRTRHKLPYAILDDRTGEVGRKFGAKTTPHMFVFDKTGKRVYEGAIDDDPRGGKANATNHVAEALEAVLAGSAIQTPETRPYGCSVKYAKSRK
jgi:peroxiredoxin